MSLERRTFEHRDGAFHALSGGDPGGRPLVFLHGFPDHPPTATEFLEHLCGRGHSVLAPWLRGYAPSPTSGAFGPPELAADVLELIDRWSPDRPVDLVGHDWGAVLTYLACAAAPERINRAVALAIPHPATFERRLRTPAQLRCSWYMGLFQLPGAGWIAGARDLALIDRLWRAWSPDFTLDSARRAELHDCLARSLPAPLKYYRSTARPRTSARIRRRVAQPIATPLLQLHGADDGCVLPPPDDDAERFAGEYEREIVPGAGHFLHLEQPAACAARVADWLAR